MSKITLTDLANLQNETTAVNAINSNNAVIKAAFDNTLSRDGTTPDQMLSTLDMNSNKIVNLPQALSGTEPVRKTEFDRAVYGTIPAPINVAGSSFETRVDLALANISASITTIVVKRYAVGSPAEPAVYVRVTGGTNPLAISDLSGGTWGVTSGFVYPEYFGAMRDGVTDDAPAIRAAAAYFGTLGITGTIRLRNGTYFLNTIATSGFLDLLTGVSYVGEGPNTIFKVKGMGSSAAFFVASPPNQNIGGSITGVEYRNFTIDGNGANNISTGYMAGIYITYGKHIDIDNITVQNFGGSQPIVIGTNAGLIGQPAAPTVSNIKITNNKFYEIGSAVNPLQNDFSCIFCIATNATIMGNQASNNVQDTLGTGYECHGTGVCSNNTTMRINQGIIVGSNPTTDYIVSNNIIQSAFIFSSFWDNGSGGQPTYDMKVVYSNNYGSCVASTNSVGFLDMNSFTTGTGNSEVKIIGNFFESLETAGTGSVQSCILGGRVKNVQIIGNTIKNFAGSAFAMGTNVVDTVQNILISNNNIVDCCTNNGVSFKAGISINGFTAYNNINITNNMIRNTGTVYMTFGIQGNVPSAVTKFNNNSISNVTTPYSWTGTGRIEGLWTSYTPTITAGSGTPTTVAATGKYKIVDNTLEIAADVVISTVGSAAGAVLITTPFPFINNTSGSGKEWNVTGKAGGVLALAGNSLTFTFYDATTAWANSNKITIYAAGQI